MRTVMSTSSAAENELNEDGDDEEDAVTLVEDAEGSVFGCVNDWEDDDGAAAADDDDDPDALDLLLPPLFRDDEDCEEEDVVEVCCWKMPSNKLDSVQLPMRCRLKLSGCCSKQRSSWFMTPAARITSRAETDLLL